jgi:hypothetical protein
VACSDHTELVAIARNRLVVVVAACLAATGCSKKSTDTGISAVELAGLAAAPANAEVVIGVDVPRVATSPMVQHAVDELLQRDPDLADKWARLRDNCKLALSQQIRHVWFVLGPHVGDKVGTGPTVMIANGQIGETDFSGCVRAMVGQGGGALTAHDSAGRTLYQAKDGSRTMYFAFGKPDTVVLGANEGYVNEALGSGSKVLDDPDMKRYLGYALQTSAIWAAGRVPAPVRQQLIGLMQGKLTAGPSAFVAAVDLSDGLKVELGAVMASVADAKALETYARAELGVIGMAAQFRGGLQRIVDKVAVRADDVVVRFTAQLTTDDINQVLSVLDGGAAPAQGSAPPGP